MEMTTHERFTRMYEHKEADRVPFSDYPWPATVARWRKEGLPTDDYVSHFGLDKLAFIDANITPRYEWKLLEETPEYTITSTQTGAVERRWKHAASTPEHLDFRVKDRESWAEAKARMRPDKSRMNWEHLEKNYKKWKDEGRWICGGLWFGYDVAHSTMLGTERVLTAMAEDPEWCMDIFETHLELSLAMMDMVWDAGYHFDEVTWPDDMGYKNATFFSLPMYRELLLPFQKRAVDWAHAKGAVVQLHSCGNINLFMPDLMEIGIDGLNPIEVKAGNDPLGYKRLYGDKLLLHGGINAVLWDDADAISEEIKRLLPELKKDGGYVFASDHSIPSSVSFENFTRVIEVFKEYGRY